MTDELKSCPFCGGPAMVEHINVESVGEGRWSAGCCDPTEGDCQGYQSLTTFARRCDAVAAWNTRAPSPQPSDTECDHSGVTSGAPFCRDQQNGQASISSGKGKDSGGRPALGKFCHACQAIPSAGYCNLAGCPNAPTPDQQEGGR